MKPERYLIHPQNAVLARLRDTRGIECGEEVLKRVLRSEIFVLLGEPAVGKSTITAQITHELGRRQIPYEVVAYDNVLAAFTAEKGTDEEGPEFNKTLVDHVLQARTRMAEVGGVVLFDTCAVGKKYPKDRSVSAVEELIHMTKEGNPFFSKLSIVGVIGPISNQLAHAKMRHEVMFIPPELVVQFLREDYGIYVEDTPPGVSMEELGHNIQCAMRRSASGVQTVQIAHEVIRRDLDSLMNIGIEQAYRIVVPSGPHIAGREQLHMRLRGAGMRERALKYGLSDTDWLTAINAEQYGSIVRYASEFLRRNKF